MSDNKTLINETTGNIDLEHAYKAAILFSAHFRYMAEDWSLGRTCLDADLNMQMNEAYERFVLYVIELETQKFRKFKSVSAHTSKIKKDHYQIGT